MPTNSSRTLTVSVACSPARALTFITDPRNLPTWAEGLGNSIRSEGGEWFVLTPTGEVRIRFVAVNSFGVADHWVRGAAGEEIYVPMRVLPNAAGCEVLLTLFQPATMSAEHFASDIGMVERDLQRLKKVLEGDMIA